MPRATERSSYAYGAEPSVNNPQKSGNRKVEVLQEDIDGGVACVASSCPVAHAIKRRIKNATRVFVDLQKISFTNEREHKRYTFLTPRKAQQFLVNFDAGVEVEPFSFHLPRPAFVTLKGRQPLGEQLVTISKDRRRKGGVGKMTVFTKRMPPANPGARMRVYGLCTLKPNRQNSNVPTKRTRKEKVA